MKRIGMIIVLGIVILSIFSSTGTATDTGLTTENQTVIITLVDKGLNVEETMRLVNGGSENVTSLQIWIQNDATTINIVAINSGKQITPQDNGFIRECNLSEANLTILPGSSLDLRVTYILPSSTQSYEKTLLYNTDLFTVSYNGRDLFQGEHLLFALEATNALTIHLYQPTETLLSTASIIIIFILVVILFAILLLSLRKQRAKTKSALVESEETLTTKKALLLELLKELEKQYRAKSISDETYTKLKEEYKQQAVVTMKKMDDLKTH